MNQDPNKFNPDPRLVQLTIYTMIVVTQIYLCNSFVELVKRLIQFLVSL